MWFIQNHKWKDLFLNKENWNPKGLSGKNTQCYVFGHAMHEKSLTPYLGMTTHTILLKQSSVFFKLPYSDQLKKIDQIVSNMWCDKKIENTKYLQPFPLLGIPGWWREKQDEKFYLNTEYFREKKPAIK